MIIYIYIIKIFYKLLLYIDLFIMCYIMLVKYIYMYSDKCNHPNKYFFTLYCNVLFTIHYIFLILNINQHI
jgi:hypothetical protein